MAKVEYLSFEVCFDCKGEHLSDFQYPRFLYTSSSEFPYCSVCAHHTTTAPLTKVDAPIRVDEITVEDCDCMEKHGRIQHNIGGNYHYTRYSVEQERLSLPDGYAIKHGAVQGYLLFHKDSMLSHADTRDDAIRAAWEHMEQI